MVRNESAKRTPAGSAGRLDSEAGNGLVGGGGEELLSPPQPWWPSQEKAHTTSDGMEVASFGSWPKEKTGGLRSASVRIRPPIYGGGKRRV